MTTLVERLDGIIDGYYKDSEDYEAVKRELERIEEIYRIVQIDSLASDGMEMIQSALRDENNGLDT